MDNNMLNQGLPEFIIPNAEDLKKFRGRLVMTVELSFELDATGIQNAEDLLNYHELRIQNAQWLAEAAHPQIKRINESLYMSRTYVAPVENGLKLG